MTDLSGLEETVEAMWEVLKERVPARAPVLGDDVAAMLAAALAVDPPQIVRAERVQRRSTAGRCSTCRRIVDKLYGGMGRYAVECIDCWTAGEPSIAELSHAGVSVDPEQPKSRSSPKAVEAEMTGDDWEVLGELVGATKRIEELEATNEQLRAVAEAAQELSSALAAYCPSAYASGASGAVRLARATEALRAALSEYREGER